MMKILLLIPMLFFVTTSWSWSALKTRMVEYRQGEAVLEGYLSYDDAFKGKRPGILVVHEWMGLNDYAKMRADMLAHLGYVAFAADIYGKGVRPSDVPGASAESAKYKNDRALLRARVQAGIDVLKGLENVNASMLGAIGYCFGGTTVLELARSGANVKGVVSFHGGLSTPTPLDAKDIKAEVLVLHGADDPFVPIAEVAAFEKEMREGNVRYQLIKYSGAVHGFTNANNKGQLKGALYNAKADRGSWQKMRQFFGRVLK